MASPFTLGRRDAKNGNTFVAVLARTRAQGVQPVDVTVFQGEIGLLTCSGTTVGWYRVVQQSISSQLVTEKMFSSPDTWHIDRGTKYDVNGTYNLVIKDAQARTDGGTYQCNTNENQQSFLNTNFLVLESLTLQVTPEGHLTRGMTLQISCTARYGGPATMSTEQDPHLELTLDQTSAFPTGQLYYQAPAAGTNFHEKILVVNYTLIDDTPGRYLRCTLRSLDYQQEEKQMLNIRFAPIIAEIVEREYNTSDSITCTADGIPEPRVTWTRISGSMPATMSGLSGMGQAVLTNLENGDHVWMCTATNELGSVSVNVSFTVKGEATQKPSTGAGGTRTTAGHVDSVEGTRTTAGHVDSEPGGLPLQVIIGIVVAVLLVIIIIMIIIIIIVVAVCVKKRRESRSGRGVNSYNNSAFDHNYEGVAPKEPPHLYASISEETQ